MVERLADSVCVKGPDFGLVLLAVDTTVCFGFQFICCSVFLPLDSFVLTVLEVCTLRDFDHLSSFFSDCVVFARRCWCGHSLSAFSL